MKVIKTNLKDCIIIEPSIFQDDRGFFLETYHEEKYKNIAGIDYNFVQDNHSKSQKGVLRGLHFQIKKPQGKLVRVTDGEVFDVAVDLRKTSPSYLQWFSVLLSGENKKQFWVPPGFAHGFLVISDTADFVYKCTDFYDSNDEGSLKWDDPYLNIKWPIAKPKVSKKDQEAGLVKDL